MFGRIHVLNIHGRISNWLRKVRKEKTNKLTDDGISVPRNDSVPERKMRLSHWNKAFFTAGEIGESDRGED